MNRFGRLHSAAFALILACLALVARGAMAEPAPPLDAEKVMKVKAAYLVKFVGYTRWSDESFATSDAPIVVDVVGDPKLALLVEKSLKDKKVGGRSIRVEYIAEPGAAVASDVATETMASAVREHHLVYLGLSRVGLADDVARLLHERDILTISDAPRFCHAGGMIGFVLKDNRIVFEANANRIKATELRVSSRVLGLATIVEEDTAGP